MPGSDRLRPTVLVTGAGGSAGCNLIRCLREGTSNPIIIGVDSNPYHLAATDADEKILVPDTSDPEWTYRLIDLRHRVDLILPQPDCDVLALAQIESEFDNRLALPSNSAVIMAQDKMLVSITLNNAQVSSVDTSMALVPHIREFLDTYGPPVWIRSRHGAGGRGSFKAYTVEQARHWIEFCVVSKSIPRSDFQVCEYLPGREFGCQQLWWHGRRIASQSRERLEYLFGYISPTGQTSSPSVARTVQDGRIDDLATNAIKAIDMRPHGVYGVDMKEDGDGRLKVTEINAGRFFTTSLFLARAGLNIPDLLLRLHTGETVIPEPPSQLPPDLYWVRIMDREPVLLQAQAFEQLKEKVPCRKQAQPNS